MSRVRAANERYGSRAFAVLFYRVLFQWPRLRSATARFKFGLLLKAQIADSVVWGKHVSVTVPGGTFAIGDGTWIGDRCVFEISPRPAAEVRLGSECFLAHDVHVGSYQRITIGNNVRIAEFTSLRDFSHSYKDPGKTISHQGDIVGWISIEDDVWIGQGCIILGDPAGTVIGKGAVIGAHSLVKGSIPANAIAVGSPARIIGYRAESESVNPR